MQSSSRRKVWRFSGFISEQVRFLWMSLFLRVPCSAAKVLQLREPATESDWEKRKSLQPSSQKCVNAPLPGQQGQGFTAGGGKRS
jgi:hypothetical protein